MSKHAYLIIAYNKFKQLSLLLNLLDDTRNDIYVLIDNKINVTDELTRRLKASVSKSKIFIYNDRKINWGDYSQIDAEMHLFSVSLQNGPYAYYHLLSGQDLPLHSQNYIHSFFDENSDKLFLTIPSDETYIKNKIPNRVIYDYRFIKYYGRSNLTSMEKKFFKLLEKINLAIQRIDGKTLRRKKHLPKIQYASNWVSLPQSAVEEIVKKSEYIFKTFNKSFLCDELFIPTLLLQCDYFKARLYTNNRMHNIPDELQGNLRYINWWDGGPYIWTDKDLDKIKYARNLGHLFSRKFDLEKTPQLQNMIIKMCHYESSKKFGIK